MTIDPTGVRLDVMLDKRRVLVFNLNTYCAFEEVQGEFFLDVLSRLYQIAREAAQKWPDDTPEANHEKGIHVVRGVSMSTVRNIVWAACHEYEGTDEDTAVWPMTRDKIGRYIQGANAIPLLMQVLDAFAKGPSKEDIDLPGVAKEEESEKDEDRPTKDPSVETNGGSTSGVSREDILGSLTAKQDG